MAEYANSTFLFLVDPEWYDYRRCVMKFEWSSSVSSSGSTKTPTNLAEVVHDSWCLTSTFPSEISLRLCVNRQLWSVTQHASGPGHCPLNHSQCLQYLPCLKDMQYWPPLGLWTNKPLLRFSPPKSNNCSLLLWKVNFVNLSSVFSGFSASKKY